MENTLHLVQQWDLSGEGARAMPTPNKENIVLPLYCVQRLEYQGKPVYGVAQYHTFRQKGSHRSGTYLGAFVETITVALDSNAVFEMLKTLVQYQLQHFVDFSHQTYQSGIFGKPCPDLPILEKWELKVAATTLFNATDHELFIPLEANEQRIEVFNLLHQTKLIEQYGKIYFSANPEISQYLQKSPQIEKLSPAYLKVLGQQADRFTQKFAQYANAYQKEKQGKEQIEQRYQELMQTMQTQIDAQVNSKIGAFQESVNQEKSRLNVHIAQLAENEKMQQNKINELNQHIRETETQNREKNNALVKIASLLNNLDQKGIASVGLVRKEELDSLKQQLNATERQQQLYLNSKDQEIANLNAYIQELKKPDFLKWLFAGLCSIFFILSCILGVMQYSNDDANKLKESTNKVEQLKNKNTELEKINKDQKIKIEELERNQSRVTEQELKQSPNRAIQGK
ncbi:hypothetical protein [Cricetibacter osteomyelitidis]|uniref:hypothetical protein n=1 Tax=Cricetibacter osteomyelitidis TaxID=1521931 RepID=UPI00104C7A37|nr:hypothetical protein [Cricetibacter osteomyelitidis]